MFWKKWAARGYPGDAPPGRKWHIHHCTVFVQSNLRNLGLFPSLLLNVKELNYFIGFIKQLYVSSRGGPHSPLLVVSLFYNVYEIYSTGMKNIDP